MDPKPRKSESSVIVTMVLPLAVMSIGSILIFITSLILSLLQILNYALFYNSNRALQRRNNFYLQDLILFQSGIVLDWISGSRVRFFFANQESRDGFGSEHLLAIGNHRYQLDSLFYWKLVELYGNLGSSKAFIKAELRMMPILGAIFHCGESIFLKRNWRSDKKSIGPAIDKLFQYKFPFQLLLLPEGTRFTPEKHQASLEFAKERNITTTLKHHLWPRVKGFAQTLHHMQAYKGKFGVYSVQVICPQNNERFGPNFEPNVKNFFNCKPFNADIYVERIDDSRLPAADASEEEHSKFLFELFKQKDELMEAHEKYSIFPNCLMEKSPRSIGRLLTFLLLNVGMSGSLLTYVIHLALHTQSLVIQCLIYGFLIIVFLGVFVVIAFMRNSNYGKVATKNHHHNNNNNNNKHESTAEVTNNNNNNVGGDNDNDLKNK